MKEIALEELIIGSTLSQDVYNDLGNIILATGTNVTQRHIDYFKSHGIEYVYLNVKESSEKKEVLSAVSQEKYRELSDNYKHMLEVYKNLYAQIQSSNVKFDAKALSEELSILVDQLIDDNNVLGAMRLLNFDEPYHFTHSINVSMISAMLAKWLNFKREDIYKIAFAGLIHDIGKAKVPQDILNKTEKLNDEEFSALKRHSRFGYELLKNNDTVNSLTLAAVLFHHERSDGSGYPNGLNDSQIPLYARIVAVADVFDAVTSDKIYRKGVSSFKAFTIIKDESFKGLDPKISEVFLKNIAAFFVNNKVRLSDGRIGEVIYLNKVALNRPLIRVAGEFIDLSSDYSIDIEEVIS